MLLNLVLGSRKVDPEWVATVLRSGGSLTFKTVIGSAFISLSACGVVVVVRALVCLERRRGWRFLRHQLIPALSDKAQISFSSHGTGLREGAFN